jgi:hypothetical protein
MQVSPWTQFQEAKLLLLLFPGLKNYEKLLCLLFVSSILFEE